MDRLTTFPNRSQYKQAVDLLRDRGLAHCWLAAEPGYAAVGVAPLATANEGAAALVQAGVITSGWVDAQAASLEAETTYAQALVEHAVAVAELRLATGEQN